MKKNNINKEVKGMVSYKYESFQGVGEIIIDYPPLQVNNNNIMWIRISNGQMLELTKDEANKLGESLLRAAEDMEDMGL